MASVRYGTPYCTLSRQAFNGTCCRIDSKAGSWLAIIGAGAGTWRS
ncbi:hypothetical protein GO009_07695 [Muricauda sp. TY007]|nr:MULTISPECIES: hypothetical protein [unclassified Allomuricauda]MBA4744684.1 hypothetical protein [Allomuricauda sp.]NDV15905.1 hypothetical protein [Muricauda sp. TY007]